MFVTHLKNVFTSNMSNDVIELPPIVPYIIAIESLCFEIREIDKATVDLNSKKPNIK